MIKPGSGTYYAPFEVSITCLTSGAQIYYTTDGSNPTTSSTFYTAPFIVSANTTVKAISVLDGEVSDVATAEYVFESSTLVQNIWESQLMDDGTVVRFANPVNVLAQHNNYLWVKDDTGYALFYGNTGQTYVNGDVIPAGFGGTMTTYSCERELYHLFGFRPASGNNPIQPELITCAQVGHETFGHYVSLHGVIINSDGSNYWVEDDNGNQVSVYFRTMGISPPANLDGVYDIVAIVGSYGRDGDCIYQLLPVKLTQVGPPIDLCEMMTMVEDGTIISVDVETQVILQSGSYLYFKQGDDCYGLIYGNVGQTYAPGDIIPRGWTAKKTTYSSEPELTSPFTGFQPATRNDVLIPEQGSPLDVNHEHWAHYVEMHNVYITEVSGNTFKITDESGNTCIGYAGLFNGVIREGFYALIQGIVGSYGSVNTIYEFLVTSFGPQPILPVKCLDELYALEPGEQAQMQFIAVYQSGVSLYVKDLCDNSGLIYGDIGLTVENGDTIEGVVYWKRYGDMKELIPCLDWRVIGHGEEVEPLLFNFIEELSPYMVHMYLKFQGVDLIDFESNQPHISDDTGDLTLFNKFDVYVTEYGPELPYDPNGDGEVNIADVNCIIELILKGLVEDPLYGKYDVWGFLTIYQGVLELYPVKIVYHANQYLNICWGDVNDDGEVNIADLNAIIEFILSH